MSRPVPLSWKLLVALPWVLALIWFAEIGWSVVQARRYMDPAWVASRVDAVDAMREVRHEPVTLRPADPDADARVWFFGSSSIAVPHWDAFTRPVVAHLEAEGRRVTVDNLGWEGMPSWNVVERVEDAFAEGDRQGIAPDVVVLYYGHNDVTYTYHLGLDKPRFDLIIGVPWVVSGEVFREHDGGNTYWFYNHRRSPILLELLQRVGLLTLDQDTFAPFLPRVLRVYRENTDRIVQIARDRGVDVMLVTPVGNYGTHPYGPLATCTEVWERAMATDDRAAKVAGWLEARDHEVFTPDMRAKGPMLDDLRARGPSALDGPAPITVCDVERLLLDGGAPFDATMFLDPVHFTEYGYDLLTAEIARCLVRGPLAPEPAPAPELDLPPP